KNEEVQQIKMAMELKDEEMLNLKKQLLEAEFSREDQLWGKNEELVQMKYEEVAAMKESNMMKLVMESDRDREEQLWVKNEELMEMRMNVEIKDQQIKELQDEVVKLRKGDTKLMEDNKVNVENAQFEATKKANRAAFAKYYKNSMKRTFEDNQNQDSVLACLLLNVLLPLLCLYVPQEMKSYVHVLSIICLLAINFFDDQADFTRILAYLGSLGASIYMPYSSQNQFYPLLLLKFFLALIYAWILKNDAIGTAKNIRFFLERASGLDMCSDERPASADDDVEPTISTPTSESSTAPTTAPFEPRTVSITKKINEELGLIVQICPESKSFFVKYIVPRGLSECPYGITIGDEILTVNGVSLKGASIEFAKSLVSAVEGSIRVELRNTSNQGYYQLECAYYL
ncbi:hypothetical protein PRIPAC_92524, partial [Pristionchus pacificus]